MLAYKYSSKERATTGLVSCCTRVKDLGALYEYLGYTPCEIPQQLGVLRVADAVVVDTRIYQLSTFFVFNVRNVKILYHVVHIVYLVYVYQVSYAMVLFSSLTVC